MESEPALTEMAKGSQIVVKVYKKLGDSTFARSSSYEKDRLKLTRKTVGTRGKAEGLGECVM